MTSLDKLLVFWPFILTSLLVPLIVITAYVWYSVPSLRGGIIICAILLILASFSSTSYTTPNNWILRSAYNLIIPSMKDLEWTIKDNSGFDHNRQAIYIWYPHSHFATVPFALLSGKMAPNTFKRPTSICVAPPLLDIPAVRQISLSFGTVRSDYDNMKMSLKQGTSMLILPGGAREVQLARVNEMNLVDGRKGFLRLAQDTGLPLVPIFCFGENEFFGNVEKESNSLVHKLFKSMKGGFQLPSMSAFKNWIVNTPNSPVNIFIGKPLMVGGERTLDELQKQWKKHINRFYKSVRPKEYSALINWKSISSTE